MKRYHTIVKIERVRKELQLGHDAEALSLAKTIPLEQLKSMSDFSVIAEAYFQNGEYETAKKYFQMIFEKTGSRRVLWQLIHTTIRLKQTAEAENYLEKFIRLAPADCYQYIFRYQIDCMEGRSLEERIRTLEKLRETEYMEHWVYELAKLYHKAGEVEKCVKECENLILWFGEGEYVERARVLRAYYKGELDVTLAGQDSKRFAAEMRKVLNSGQRETILNKVERTVKQKEVERETRISEEERRQQTSLSEQIKAMEAETVQPEIQNIQVAKEEPDREEESYSKEASYQKEESQEKEEVQGKETLNKKEVLNKKEMPDEKGEAKEEAISKQEAPDEGQVTAGRVWNKPESFGTVPTYREMLARAGKQRGSAAIAKKRLGIPPVDTVSSKSVNSTEELAGEKTITESSQEEEVYQDILNKMDEVVQSLDWPEEPGGETACSEMPVLPEKPLLQPEMSEDIARSERRVPAAVLMEPESVEMPPEAADKGSGQTEAESKEYDSILEEESLLCQALLEKGEDFEELFGSFARMDATRPLLISNLERILKQNKARIIISRENPSIYGTMELAKRLARTLYRLGVVETAKTALIQGEKLNQMSLKKAGQQLKGCSLIIEHPGVLRPEKVGELFSFCRQFDRQVGVILVDSKEGIGRLFRMKKEFESVFGNKFYLRTYSVKDWMELACGQIRESDYEIDEMARKALVHKLSAIMEQKKDEQLWETICFYVKLVMEQTEQRNAKLLFEMSVSGRFDPKELMIIRPEDLQAAEKLL